MLEFVRLINNKKITLKAFVIGCDIQVLCYGGDKPHIGAVSLAVPYENDGKNCASVSTLTALTHREDIISRQLAESLCKQFKTSVAVSCGIHFEQISRELIVKIQDEILEMSKDLICELQAKKSTD